MTGSTALCLVDFNMLMPLDGFLKSCLVILRRNIHQLGLHKSSNLHKHVVLFVCFDVIAPFLFKQATDLHEQHKAIMSTLN